jgi:hypothetical protein
VKLKTVKLFHKQRGLCWICNLPMKLKTTLREDPLEATLDHLVRSHKGPGQGPIRPTRAAHRFCNKQRKHKPTISEDALQYIRELIPK